MSSELEKIFQKQNGKNWRFAKVLNFSFDHSKNEQILQNKEFLKDLIQQIDSPSQIVISSTLRSDIINLFSALIDDKFKMTQTVTKLFIDIHNRLYSEELAEKVNQLIQLYKSLQELHILHFSLDYIDGAESHLSNLKIINVQSVDDSKQEALAKSLLQIPTLETIIVQFGQNGYTTAQNFFTHIYQHKNIQNLNISFSNYTFKKKKKINEDQTKMINSANYLSQMERLQNLKIGFQKYFQYLPQFLKCLSQSLRIDSFSISIYDLSLKNVQECLKSLALSYAKTFCFTAALKDLQINIPLNLLDDLKRCPNLNCLSIYIICQIDQSLVEQLKIRMKKKCIRLVKIQYFFD